MPTGLGGLLAGVGRHSSVPGPMFDGAGPGFARLRRHKHPRGARGPRPRNAGTARNLARALRRTGPVLAGMARAQDPPKGCHPPRANIATIKPGPRVDTYLGFTERKQRRSPPCRTPATKLMRLRCRRLSSRPGLGFWKVVACQSARRASAPKWCLRLVVGGHNRPARVLRARRLPRARGASKRSRAARTWITRSATGRGARTLFKASARWGRGASCCPLHARTSEGLPRPKRRNR